MNVIDTRVPAVVQTNPEGTFSGIVFSGTSSLVTTPPEESSIADSASVPYLRRREGLALKRTLNTRVPFTSV